MAHLDTSFSLCKIRRDLLPLVLVTLTGSEDVIVSGCGTVVITVVGTGKEIGAKSLLREASLISFEEACAALSLLASPR